MKHSKISHNYPSLLSYKKSTFEFVRHIKEICRPFFEKTQIDYFCYIKSNNAGGMLHVTSNGHWLEYFVDNELFELSNFRKSPNEYAQNIVLCSYMKGPAIKIANDAAQYFNIKNVITLVEKRETECEFFQFGSQKEGIVDFYFNNIDILKLFTVYFKDKASKLIKLAGEKNIFLPPMKTSYSDFFVGEEAFPTRQVYHDLYGNIGRFFIGNIDEDVYLTKKEIECLKWHHQGKTAWEIAIIMNNSARTIEKHFENIKVKLNCNKLTKVIEIIVDRNPLFLLPP